MSVFIGEQAFSRLQIREKMSMADGTRTTNLVMACNLMFLYSHYRLIGIAHQQAMNPMTEQEANERACLLNSLFNADLSGYDFLTKRADSRRRISPIFLHTHTGAKTSRFSGHQ